MCVLATTRHRACVCVRCVSNVISGLAWNTVHELVSTPKHPALACRLRGTSASRKLRNARIEQLADSLATRLIHFHPVVEGLFGFFSQIVRYTSVYITPGCEADALEVDSSHAQLKLAAAPLAPER